MALKEIDINIINHRECYYNRYPKSTVLSRKKTLAQIMNRFERVFENDYSFNPKSFLLPEQEMALERYLEKKSNTGKVLIGKPSRGSGGEGIFLMSKTSDIPRSLIRTQELLVQRYIDNPLLIENKKFDLRLYVLIKGIDPLEAYLCEEGLARFCTV